MPSTERQRNAAAFVFSVQLGQMLKLAVTLGRNVAHVYSGNEPAPPFSFKGVHAGFIVTHQDPDAPREVYFLGEWEDVILATRINLAPHVQTTRPHAARIIQQVLVAVVEVRGPNQCIFVNEAAGHLEEVGAPEIKLQVQREECWALPIDDMILAMAVCVRVPLLDLSPTSTCTLQQPSGSSIANSGILGVPHQTEIFVQCLVKIFAYLVLLCSLVAHVADHPSTCPCFG